MFDYLSGTLSFLGQGRCVVDTHGIGWNLIISTKSAARFSGQKEVKVYTHLNMGSGDRSVMELYGFYTPREREFFHLLIDVSGIGPKAAIAILSALDPEELCMCILSGDAKAITAAQGVGMKMAQKILLELKDKVAKSVGSESVVSAAAPAPTSDLSEAINALVVLGYPYPTAAAAVRGVADKAKDLQDLIRLALKSIGA